MKIGYTTKRCGRWNQSDHSTCGKKRGREKWILIRALQGYRDWNRDLLGASMDEPPKGCLRIHRYVKCREPIRMARKS